MELSNEFQVGVPVEQAWAVLTDVERIAPCMPGCQLTDIEGEEFRGTIKVKVGPITAQYKGKARFIVQDMTSWRAVLQAEGRDTRGQGNASAMVTATLTPDGSGTIVRVATDLTITGKVAQFGRGVLADVSGKLIDQFVACLERDVLRGDAAGDAPAAGAGVVGDAAVVAGAGGADSADAAAIGGADGEGGNAGETVPAPAPAKATAAKPPKVAAKATKAAKAVKSVPAKVAPLHRLAPEDGALPHGAPLEVEESGSPAVGDAGGPPLSATQVSNAPTESVAGEENAQVRAAPTAPAIRRINSAPAEPVDLLGTAGKPVIKRAAPLAAGALVLAWLLRRRRRRLRHARRR